MHSSRTPSLSAGDDEPGLQRHMYIVITVGAVLVIAVGIMLLFVCLACVQNKRSYNKKPVIMARQVSSTTSTSNMIFSSTTI